MQWLLNLFSRSQNRPTHKEVETKVRRIKEGNDRSSIQVDTQKIAYYNHLKQIRKQARIAITEAKKVDAAIGVALLTRGY